MRSLSWGDDALSLRIEWAADTFPHLVGLSGGGLDIAFPDHVPLVEILTVGAGHVAASDRLTHTRVGHALRYEGHDVDEGSVFRVLRLRMLAEHGGLGVELVLRAALGTAALQARVVVTNRSTEEVILRSATSWVSPFGRPGGTQGPDGLKDAASADGSESIDDWHLLSGRSDWLAEGRWTHSALRGHETPRLGHHLTGHNPRGAHSRISTGTWSTGKNLPVGGLESPSRRIAWMWQLEHNGAWRWEVGENAQDGYLALSGPTEIDHNWSTTLSPGASFETVPVSIAIANNFTAATAELTVHRRRLRRAHTDNASMAVVFNDYMNTLNGDPTTAQLLPLVDAAAEVGAEIFCIDAGWYDDSGNWWDTVGEWMPSGSRFPLGLGEVIDRIRSHGMVPGLWLEPESVGVRSPVADTLPLDAFFQRGGQRVVEHDRYHLDLRHPAAIAHLDGVVDRLVGEFGVGFFKMDYNINPGAGTDVESESSGAGLLSHNRAHLRWVDAVLDRHPQLILENCASGAMRSDFALLGRMQLQSTSDQQDPLIYPPIAASAPLSMLPEQAANWAYPQPSMSDEEIAFTVATGVLGRLYLSGHLARMTAEQRRLVADGVAAHRELRDDIAHSTPFWPMGLPQWDADWVSLGLLAPERRLITIWNRSESADEVALRLPGQEGVEFEIRTVFPVALPVWDMRWSAADATLHVRNPRSTIGARIIELRIKAIEASTPHSSDDSVIMRRR